MQTPAVLAVLLSLAACSAAPVEPEETAAADAGALWVMTSAEYRALAQQAYRAATDALAAKIADKSWSALPEQTAAENLPPAVILDVDETVVTNPQFQLEYIPPFSEDKFNDWNATHPATPVPGVVAFARAARALGVELFFITNRLCTPDGKGNACPQKSITVDDLNEAGVPATAGHVMLVAERPGWNKEKKNRRDVVAKDYRVIMLFGDDLNDFIACSRQRAVPPCAAGATNASRKQATAEFADYWGNGWYVLPNPMYGSWTSVQ